jgi:hypothetical protein
MYKSRKLAVTELVQLLARQPIFYTLNRLPYHQLRHSLQNRQVGRNTDTSGENVSILSLGSSATRPIYMPYPPPSAITHPSLPNRSLKPSIFSVTCQPHCGAPCHTAAAATATIITTVPQDGIVVIFPALGVHGRCTSGIGGGSPSWLSRCRRRCRCRSSLSACCTGQ